MGISVDITVECDNCGEEETIEPIEYCGDPPSWGIDDETLKQHGWERDGGEIFCKMCREERERGEEDG